MSFHWANSEEMTLEDFDRDTTEEYILLAEEYSFIRGFVSLYLPDNFIHNLFVHPDFTSRGVGTQLVNNAMVIMNKPIRLKCLSENHRALLFYEKNGWKKVIEEGNPGERYWVLVNE